MCLGTSHRALSSSLVVLEVWERNMILKSNLPGSIFCERSYVITHLRASQTSPTALTNNRNFQLLAFFMEFFLHTYQWVVVNPSQPGRPQTSVVFLLLSPSCNQRSVLCSWEEHCTETVPPCHGFSQKPFLCHQQCSTACWNCVEQWHAYW